MVVLYPLKCFSSSHLHTANGTELLYITWRWIPVTWTTYWLTQMNRHYQLPITMQSYMQQSMKCSTSEKLSCYVTSMWNGWPYEETFCLKKKSHVKKRRLSSIHYTSFSFRHSAAVNMKWFISMPYDHMLQFCCQLNWMTKTQLLTWCPWNS
jgi:hypothetical protein